MLKQLPSKMLSLASGRLAEVVELQGGELGTRVAQVVGQIQRATFTGKGDKKMVPNLYKLYVERIVCVLQETLAFSVGTDAVVDMLPPMPALAAALGEPPACRLAAGHLLLLLSD